MDEDCTEEINIAHAILHSFQYQYRDRWVSQKELLGRSRIWNKVFNNLIKEGLIEKKKSVSGMKYRWKAQFPRC